MFMSTVQEHQSSPIHALTFAEMTPVPWCLQLVRELVVQLFSDAFQPFGHRLDLDEPG